MKTFNRIIGNVSFLAWIVFVLSCVVLFFGYHCPAATNRAELSVTDILFLAFLLLSVVWTTLFFKENPKSVIVLTTIILYVLLIVVMATFKDTSTDICQQPEALLSIVGGSFCVIVLLPLFWLLVTVVDAVVVAIKKVLTKKV